MLRVILIVFMLLVVNSGSCFFRDSLAFLLAYYGLIAKPLQLFSYLPALVTQVLNPFVVRHVIGLLFLVNCFSNFFVLFEKSFQPQKIDWRCIDYFPP